MRSGPPMLDSATIEQLQKLSLGARRVVESSLVGLHRSTVKGASVEFREHRAYCSGDEPRRIDWRVLARTDRLCVREYDEETNLRCLIALDQSRSMSYGQGFQSKFDYACRLTAAIGYLLLSNQESVGFAGFSNSLTQWTAPTSHLRQLARLIDLLERASPSGIADPEAAAKAIVERVERRAVVVWISDFFVDLQAFRRSLARLQHARHEIICLQVLHPDEQGFPFAGPIRLLGLELESPRRLEPAGARAGYLKRFEAHEKSLNDCCRSASVEFFTLPTSTPPATALVDLIRRRAR